MRKPVAIGGFICVVALVVASCGAPSASTSSDGQTAEQAGASPMGHLIYARELSQRSDLLIVDADSGNIVRRLPWGAASSDWSVIYRVETEGGSSVVRVFDAASGAKLRERVLAGPYQYGLPTIGAVGEPGGLSPDGRWLALHARANGPEAKSAFAIIDTELKGPSTAIELPGDFTFDGLSNGGSTLYLEERVWPGRPSGLAYRVRAYDVPTRSLLPGVIADKGSQDGVMSGMRVAALSSPSGEWLYSLYSDPARPFIHTLNLQGRFSVCLFLPTRNSGNGEEQLAWAFAPTPDGRRAYALNTLMGVVAEVNLGSTQITRSGFFQVARGEPNLFESMAGWFVPVAEAKSELFSHATVSPDGKTVYAVGDFGRLVLAIGTDTLAVKARFRMPSPIKGLGLSGDGASLYATSEGAAGSLLRIDAAGGAIVRGLPLDGRAFRILHVASR